MTWIAFGFFALLATASMMEIEQAARTDREFFPFLWVATLSLLCMLTLAVIR